jgi:hypothetical protein
MSENKDSNIFEEISKKYFNEELMQTLLSTKNIWNPQDTNFQRLQKTS